jgi:hypothetical protein
MRLLSQLRMLLRLRMRLLSQLRMLLRLRSKMSLASQRSALRLLIEFRYRLLWSP